MRKIYLVKKNPEKPAGKENWIVMNSYDFAMFMKTPEGKKRRPNFGQLDGCDLDDVIIIAECGQDKADQWRAEKDRHDYLKEVKAKMGYTTFSYQAIASVEGDEMTGEDLLHDPDTDVEETVIIRIMKDKLRIAVMSLDEHERHLIEKMFLTAHPMTEEEYARLTGKNRGTIHYQKMRILGKLKSLLEK